MYPLSGDNAAIKSDLFLVPTSVIPSPNSSPGTTKNTVSPLPKSFMLGDYYRVWSLIRVQL